MHALLLAATLHTFNQVSTPQVLLKFDPMLNQRFEYDVTITSIIREPGRRTKTATEKLHRTEKILAVESDRFTQDVKVVSRKLSRSLGTQSTFEEQYQKTLLSNGVSFDGEPAQGEGLGMYLDLRYSDSPVSVGDQWTCNFFSNSLADRLATFRLIALSKKEARILGWADKQEGLATKDPFLYIVDRKTGKPKFVRGEMQFLDGTRAAKIEMRMTSPIRYRTRVR